MTTATPRTTPNKNEFTFYFRIGPLHDPVVWYGINYTGTRIMQCEFQNKGGRDGLVRVSLFWKSHCVVCVPA